jgi:ribosome-associated translation inhibitor RaiA
MVEAETAWLQRYFVELLAARWTLAIDRDEIVARCELHARCGRFVGEGRSISLPSALAQATDRAARWRRRLKRMSQRRRRADRAVELMGRL